MENIRTEIATTETERRKTPVIEITVFVLLFCVLFVMVSYIMRPTDGVVNRRNIMSYYNERPDTIDVIYIGGSSTYVFWAPMQAWHEAGITSYDLAGSEVPLLASKYLLIEALKTQTPKAVVIDLRALANNQHTKAYTVKNMRNVTDFMPYSVNRYNCIENYVKYGGQDIKAEERIMLHIDFLRYHSQWKQLNGNSIKYAFQKIYYEYKGFELRPRHDIVEMQDFSSVSTRKIPSEENKRDLFDILEFCKKENIPACFVINPYHITLEQKMHFNWIGDIIAEYGFPFINTNDYYDEMGLDNSKDYYDKNHVNIFGAEKYTRFMTEWLKQHFDLPDHRGEEGYQSWDEDYKKWENDVENTKSKIEKLISAY